MKFELFGFGGHEEQGNGMELQDGRYSGERVLVGKVDGEEIRIEEGISENADYSYTYSYTGSKGGVAMTSEEAQTTFDSLLGDSVDKSKAGKYIRAKY